MDLIDPYQIATCGQNSRNTFTLASNGILVDVEITDLPPIIIPPIDDEISGGATTFLGGEKEERITHKQITVTATINGVKYKETKIVEDKPNLHIKDVDVDVVETKSKKPKINITVK